MHVDLPKMPMESMKDIAKHYLMIVLGILTALGLEAGIEHIHHKHAASEASMQIEAEIRENRSAIQSALDNDKARAAELQKVRDQLISDIKANASDAVILQHIQSEAPNGIYVDWRWPPMSHSAWDVTVANQSAGWIDNEKLHRYAIVYAAQTARGTAMATDMQWLMNGPQAFDTVLDLQIGQVQPRELLHSVNQMWFVVQESSQSLTGLAKTIDDAMAGSAAGH